MFKRCVCRIECRIREVTKIGTHCVRVGSESAERVVDLAKHCIHEINALVSLERAECLANKKTQKQLHSSSKIVSLQNQRFRGIQM